MQHQCSAHLEHHEQLIKTVVKPKRQQIDDDVVARVLQVGADGSRRGYNIQMSNHHALWPTRRARCVDECREIDVDAFLGWGLDVFRPFPNLFEGDQVFTGRPDGRGLRFARSKHDYGLKIRCLGPASRAEERLPPHVTIADARQLLRM